MSFKIGNSGRGPQGIPGAPGPTGPMGVFNNIVTADLLPSDTDINIGSDAQPFKTIYLDTSVSIGTSVIVSNDNSLKLPPNTVLGELKVEDLISRLEYLENEVKVLKDIIHPYS